MAGFLGVARALEAHRMSLEHQLICCDEVARITLCDHCSCELTQMDKLCRAACGVPGLPACGWLPV